MTSASSQEEILQNTKTVMQGLEALKSEHHSVKNGLLQTLSVLKEHHEESSLIEGKAAIVERSLETIQLGIEEAQVCPVISNVFLKFGIESISIFHTSKFQQLILFLSCFHGNYNVLHFCLYSINRFLVWNTIQLWSLYIYIICLGSHCVCEQYSRKHNATGKV